MANDYSALGLDQNLNSKNNLGNRQIDYITALRQNLRVEPTPYVHRTAISKGTVQTNLGGLLELRDTTGGTILLTADPKTGTVTIAGPLQANVTLNLGTINNTSIAGQGTIIGTINNTKLINNGTWNNGTMGTPAVTGGTMTNSVLNSNVIGTPILTGGTLNPALYQIGGTAGADGSLVYVKTVNFAGSTTTLGTMNFAKGIIISFN